MSYAPSELALVPFLSVENMMGSCIRSASSDS